ncbi:conserved membrane hypothetical protein [[Clostridium] ultunense Esp]|nr:conserved membrane hypothetical protein [[Clostridium] ultunense Esp]
MERLYIGLLFAFSLFSFLSLYLRMAYTYKWLVPNYKGISIPVGMGVVLPVSFILITPFLNQGEGRDASFLLLLFLMAGVGWYDDLWGEKEAKGVRGHFRLLWKEKKISSGIWKIVAAFVAGVFLLRSMPLRQWEWAVGLFSFMLSVHLINLLDVRPLRALKGFWFLLILLLLSHHQIFSERFLMIYISTFILGVYDGKELAMMGDAGANLLGGIIGYYLLHLGSPVEWLLFSGVGMLITLYAESNSLSRFIDSNFLLRKIDRLGRG